MTCLIKLKGTAIMKPNYYIIIFILFFPLFSFAQNTDINSDSQQLPNPVSGIHVVPDTDLTMTEPMRIKMSSQLKQKNEKGYIEIDSSEPRQLISLKYSAANEIKENKNKGPHDTHLKANISDIQLAFAYKGIPFINKSDVIGFAAAGGYKNGWTGIGEFFNDSKLGTCTLTLYNIALSHGGVRLGKSVVKYLVNNKPTTINIEGSINSGFMYKVHWFDNTFIHELECANMDFNEKITVTMVDYARLIDKSLVST